MEFNNPGGIIPNIRGLYDVAMTAKNGADLETLMVDTMSNDKALLNKFMHSFDWTTAFKEIKE